MAKLRLLGSLQATDKLEAVGERGCLDEFFFTSASNLSPVDLREHAEEEAEAIYQDHVKLCKRRGVILDSASTFGILLLVLGKSFPVRSSLQDYRNSQSCDNKHKRPDELIVCKELTCRS